MSPHMPEFFCNEIDDCVMLQIACSRNDQIVRCVELAEEIDYLLAIQFVNGLLSSQDRSPQRLIFPEILDENLMDKIVWRVLHHFDLFENDAALPLHVSWVEFRI